MTQSLQNIYTRERELILTHTLKETGSLKGTEDKMWDVSGGQNIRYWDAMSEIALLIHYQSPTCMLFIVSCMSVK